MQLTYGAATDTGRRRHENEDSLLVDFDPTAYPGSVALFAVCDGVGGAVAGKTASALAAGRIGTAFRESRLADPSERLVEAAEHAGTLIFEHTLKQPATEGMATTLVAAAFDGTHCYVVNVGDSRAYCASAGRLRQLTHDHTLVQEQVANGLLSADDVADSPYRHIITRSLGREPVGVGAESYPSIPLAAGQRYILCSDGLTDMVAERDILAVASTLEPEQAAGALVDLANRNGGRDNVTVIVIGIGEAAGER